MDGTLHLVDTNILVCLFDAQDPEKHDRAVGLVARCWKGETRYAVSVQNLAEFATVVTEKVENPMPLAVAREFISAIEAFHGWEKVGYSGRTVAAALGIKEQYRLHFWDALLVATMLENRIRSVISEDRHLSRIPGIAVIDPFETRRSRTGR